MDLSPLIASAAVVSILANVLKVWEFVSTRIGCLLKNGTGHTPRQGVLPCYESMASTSGFHLDSSILARTSK